MKSTVMGKVLAAVLCVVGLIGMGCVVVSAQEYGVETLPDAYGEIQEAMPDEVAELLPEGYFSQDPAQAMSAVETVAKPAYLLKTILRMVGVGLEDVVQLFVILCGLLLLSALLKHIQGVTGKNGEIFSYCLRLCMYVIMVTKAMDMLTWVKGYFDALNTLMQGMIPVVGILYTVGGNVGQATMSGEMFAILLGACQYMATALAPALCGICLAFALMEAFGGNTALKLSPLSGLCKKWYTSLMGFLMFLLTAALSVQSILTAKADTLSMRGVKYAVGQMLPMVGGAVSGTLGSVSSAVGLLRGIVGVSGILLLLLLLLPTLIQLLLFRGCYQLACAVGGMLSCDGEAKLLGEVGSLYGYMAATVSVCVLAFVIALAIFAQGTVALGGG